MLRRLYQNSDVHMTKDTYFEMCEMLGEEPIEEEIPVDLDDFPDLVQQSFLIYNMLQDTWDGMSGTYMGKDFSILFSLFDVYEVAPEERLLCISFMQTMDSIRAKLVADKIKTK